MIKAVLSAKRAERKGETMKFKLWCVEHKLTARKVVEITGIPYQTICAYRAGTRRPTREREKEMCEKLGMPAGLFD